MVNVSNDGDIPYRLGSRHGIPFLVFGRLGFALGCKKRSDAPHSAAISIVTAALNAGI
jgi:hypothetical protein